MIVAFLTAVIGMTLMFGLYAFISNRRARLLAEIVVAVEKDVVTKARRKGQVDSVLVDALERGAPIDQTISDYQDKCAGILPTPYRTSEPWRWDSDDLDRWKDSEVQRRTDDVTRRVVLHGIAGALSILVATVAISAASYTFDASRTERNQERIDFSAPIPAFPVPLLNSLPNSSPSSEVTTKQSNGVAPLQKPVIPIDVAKHRQPLSVSGDKGAPGFENKPVSAPRAAAESRSGNVIRGRVVSRSNGSGIGGAEVSVLQDRARTASDGSFELKLSFIPGPTDHSLLRVAHPSHIAHVERLFREDAREREIQLDPRKRVMVASFRGTLTGEAYQRHRSRVRSSVENRLARCNDIELKASENLDDVVRQLFAYQETRGLYDKASLVEIGNFTGATHGVFGTLESTGADGISVSCELVELRSARKEASAQLRFANADLLASACDAVTDQLIAELSQIEILSPHNKASSPRQTRVSGSYRFAPDSWHLWIVIQPDETTLCYPQSRAKENDDGTWVAQNVQIGEEKPKSRDQQFGIYAVLTDPEANRKFEEYQKDIQTDPTRNTGLDITALVKSQHCRFVSRIDVSREDSKNTQALQRIP